MTRQTNEETKRSKERTNRTLLPPFVVSVDQQEIVMNATKQKTMSKRHMRALASDQSSKLT